MGRHTGVSESMECNQFSEKLKLDWLTKKKQKVNKMYFRRLNKLVNENTLDYQSKQVLHGINWSNQALNVNCINHLQKHQILITKD